MPLITRLILVLSLVLTLSAALTAQEAPATTGTATATTEATATDTAAATETATGTATATTPATPDAAETEAARGDEEPVSQTEREAAAAHKLRIHFTNVLENHPREVAMILKLDPSLMRNREYVGQYPELVQILEENPEIVRNPHYYLGLFRTPAAGESALEAMFEALAVIVSMLLAIFALSWLVRTIIDQKRWNRLTRTQTEVHNKILDRFGSSEEVLEYIKTPAGSKFLESAPIPLHAERKTSDTPVPRITWSIQAGVVVAAAGIGMLLVGLFAPAESGIGFLALGAIAFCVGAGFIGSAVVSILLSRRLGIWQGPGASETNPLNDSGLVR